MRHRNAGRKFKRTPEHRRMLFRNLATALFEHEKITTTLAKAKELQPYAEKLISLARGGLPEKNPVQLAKFRRALAVITQRKVCYKLFHEIGPRFADRSGGYTRIYKIAKVRQGDAAPMAMIALLGAGEEVVKAPQRPAMLPAGD